jgi:pimeloyl-ACP methyl ester carboxylesterase
MSGGVAAGGAATPFFLGNRTVPLLQQADELADRLSAACESGTEVDFYRTDEKLWALALDRLIARAKLEAARIAGQRLGRAYPASRFFQTMAGILSLMPPAGLDSSFAGFCDDPLREVQIVPHHDARVVLLGFCGRAQRMGMPLNLIHRWFGPLNAHVVYLRDYSNNHYDNGIRALAPDFRETLQVLRDLIANLGTSRVVCYGNSLGGYGALRYALGLQAEAVLSFAGPTVLHPSYGESLLQQRGLAGGLNLRPLYERALSTPRVHLVYSEHHANDRKNALNFHGLRNVTMEMAQGGVSHDAFLHTLFNGRYEPLIRWLVDPKRSAGVP